MRADAVLPLPIEVWSGPAVQSLPAEERAAIVDLFVAAWRSADATVPGDDQGLAVLSGLGPRWYASQLRARLPVWFAPADPAADDRRLVCRPLADARATVTRWRDKSSAGGRLSAERRAMVRASSKGGCKGGSTTLATTLGAASAPERACPLPQPACAEATTADAGTAASSRGAVARPVFGAQALYMTGACDVSKGGSAKNELEMGGVCVSHTLLNSSMGVQGGGDPRDLFGGKVRGKNPDQEDLAAIGAVLDAFLRNVSAAYRPEARAERAIYAHLCAGLSQRELIESCLHYGQEMDALGKPPRYRLSAASFFDPASGHVEAYQRPRQAAQDGAGPTILPIGGQPPAGSREASPWDGFAERVAANLGERAPDWYPRWCRRHATRFAFKKLEDADVLARWWDDVGADGYTEDELEAASQALARIARMAEPMSRLQHKTALFNQLKSASAQRVIHQQQAKAAVVERNLKAADPLAEVEPAERKAIEDYVRKTNPALPAGSFVWTAKVLERLRAVCAERSGALSQSPCGPPPKGEADVHPVARTGGSAMPPNR